MSEGQLVMNMNAKHVEESSNCDQKYDFFLFNFFVQPQLPVVKLVTLLNQFYTY